ncbi:MAG: Ig-like domain-containing protein, partial [Bacteroidota bacterium]|nr:Ig-like domain-containing protein [Bacteroidota bacterium]
WGTFNIQADINIWTSGSPSPRIDNYGTFRKSNTAGITQINVVFHNIGTVQGYSGTIQLSNGGTSNGEWNTGDNAYIDFTGGTYIIQTGTSFTGTGFTRVNGATVNVNGTIPAVNFAVVAGSLSGDSTLTISGTFNWSGGTMLGTGMTVVDTGGSVNITSAVSKTLNGRTLTLRSNVTTVCTGSFTMSNSAVIANWGTFNIQADINIWTSGSPTPHIENYGTFRRTTTTGTTSINPTFNNTGTAEAKVGTLYFGGGFRQTAGITVLGGGTIGSNSTIDIQGGMLSGSGIISAGVNNAGILSPGTSAGSIRITGNYTQSSSGMFHVEIGGRDTTRYDRLKVTGTATLLGALDLNLIDGFRPIGIDTFQIMCYGSRSGNFDIINGLDIGGGFRLDTTFTSSCLVLKTITPPNNPPIARNDTVSTPENSIIQIHLLSNDSDPDGDTLKVFALDTSLTSGRIFIGSGDTTVIYSPRRDWFGVDSFSYIITDGKDISNSALVIVYINNIGHPRILSIRDVPNDQGSHVTVKWKASPLDTNVSTLPFYSIWRAIPQGSVQKSGIVPMTSISGDFKGIAYRVTSTNGATYFWEWIANQPAHRFSEYSYTAPTLYDSMSTTDGKHYYLVSAHTSNPNVFYDSNVDSGYSVDNLAPLAPKGFVASFAAGQVSMHWNANSESDLHSYVLYRGTSPANLVELGTTIDTQYVDQSPLPGNSYYAVRAMDIHENLSPFSNTIITGMAEGDKQFPREYALYHNYPNPFNPSTSIKYALPQASHVSLGVFNTLGQRVALLVDGKQEAGYHEVNFSASGLTSGVYFYRLQAHSINDRQATDYVETKKLILMK